MNLNKNISKNKKGMTLVEVLVAMIIFFLMFSCVLSILSVSVKMSALSRSRDIKTAEQAANISKKSDTDLNAETGTYTVNFTDSGGTESATKTLYKSVFARVGETFDFQLNTFRGTAGSVSTIFSGSDDYKVQITNSLTESVTLYVTIKDTAASAFIYEGDPSTGYIHPSKAYVKHIDDGGTIEFGFHDENAGLNSDIDLQYYAVSQSGTTYGTYNATFDSSSKTHSNTI